MINLEVYVILHSCMYLPTAFITILPLFVIKLIKSSSGSIFEIFLKSVSLSYRVCFDFHIFDIGKENVPHPQSYYMLCIICPLDFLPTYLPLSILSLCVLILKELKHFLIDLS